MTPTHHVRRVAVAVLAAASLSLTACSTESAESAGPASTTESAPSLEHYDLAGLDAPQIIDRLDAMPVSDRPTDLLASVQPTELVLSSGRENLATLALPDDRFYLSVAPYDTETHPCRFHSLTTCIGELAGKQVHVTVTDEAGRTLIDEPRTTYDNGFVGLWLPRDTAATLTIEHDGKTATTPISTSADDLTCLTTMWLD